MMTEQEALEESYQGLDQAIGDLVETFAIPHTKTCMRWGKPSREAYRTEVVNWLQDYGKSFARIPRRGLPGRPDLPAFARGQLDAEVERVIKGQNADVERSYAHLFE